MSQMERDNFPEKNEEATIGSGLFDNLLFDGKAQKI
jgi:hypothetical protein